MECHRCSLSARVLAWFGVGGCHGQVPDLLTVEEAAEVLRIGRTLAYQLAQTSLETNGAEGIPCRRDRPAVAGAEQGARRVGGRADHLAAARAPARSPTRDPPRPVPRSAHCRHAHRARELAARLRADTAALRQLTGVAPLTHP